MKMSKQDKINKNKGNAHSSLVKKRDNIFPKAKHFLYIVIPLDDKDLETDSMDIVTSLHKKIEDNKSFKGFPKLYSHIIKG